MSRTNDKLIGSSLLAASLLAIAGILPQAAPATAATRTWVTAGGNWADAANWSGGLLPATADTARIQTTSANAILETAATVRAFYLTAGALTITSSGLLTVTGVDLNLTGGALMLDGGALSADGRSVLINNGSVVRGNGTITVTGSGKSVSVGSNGTIAPGAAGEIGALNIVGPATFASGSTYEVHIGENGQSDRIDVSGVARIQSGATLSVVPLSGVSLANGWSYDILKAGSFADATLFTNSTAVGAFAYFTQYLVDTDTANGADTLRLSIAGVPGPPAPITTVPSGDMRSPGGMGVIATDKITGDVVFKSGSVYAVDVGYDHVSDRVEASGKATIENGAKIAISKLAGMNYANGWEYTVLISSSREGQFDDPYANGSFATFTADYSSPTGVKLKISSVAPVDFRAAATTPNQITTAGALNTVNNSSALYNAVYLVTAADVQPAFDQLSGGIHAAAKTALIEDSHFVRDAMNSRLLAAFDRLVSTPAGGDGAAPANKLGFAMWATGIGAWGENSGADTGKVERTIGGVVGGADALLLDTVRVGGVAGYMRSSYGSALGNAEAENYHLGAYAGTRWGALSLRSGLAYSWHDIDTERSVGFDLITNASFTDKLSATYEARTSQAFGELGWQLGTSTFGLEPFANVARVSLENDAFKEAGGAAALSVSDEKTSVTFSTLGLRLASGFQLGKIATVARGTVGWQHAFGDVAPLSTNAFATGNTFTVAGAPIASDVAVVEAGVDLHISRAGTLGLFYSGQHGADASENGLNARLNLKF